MKYSKVVLRKLILGITALSLTTVCLVSTTFAWFAKNANAWTEQFEIDLSINEGLQISVDKVNYYDSIDKNQLRRAIALKKYNKLNPNNTKAYSELTEDEIIKYSNIVLAPVSPDANYNFYGFYSNNYIESDLRNYIENGKFKPINFTEKNDLKYLDTYVEFDLYFKAIASSKEPYDSYYLRFASREDETDINAKYDESYIKSNDSTINLTNKLSTSDKEFVSGESIVVNPENAARLATVQYNNDGTINNDYNLVFEPNEGYSSSAYENGTGKNDPSINPMVTYFNNSHNLAKLYLKDVSEKVETKKTFYGNNLGQFAKTQDGSYTDVKITMYLWLDGYDGDYLEGVDTNSMKFYLSFTKVGV